MVALEALDVVHSNVFLRSAPHPDPLVRQREREVGHGDPLRIDREPGPHRLKARLAAWLYRWQSSDVIGVVLGNAKKMDASDTTRLHTKRAYWQELRERPLGAFGVVTNVNAA